MPLIGSRMTAATLSASASRNVRSASRVVVGQDRRGGCDRLGDAGAGRRAEGGEAAAALHEQVVGAAVVAALELHHDVLAGEAAGRAEGPHHGLGAARDEPHHLDRREEPVDLLGDGRLLGGRRAVGGAPGGGLLDRLHDRRVGVAHDHRAPAADVVDVAGAVGAVEVRALGAIDEDRRAADGAEGADGGVHPTGHPAAGFFEEASGFGVGHDGGDCGRLGQTSRAEASTPGMARPPACSRAARRAPGRHVEAALHRG